MYVLVKVLQVRRKEFIYQKALFSAELQEIFSEAPLQSPKPFS